MSSPICEDSKVEDSKVSVRLGAWEAPAFTETKIAAATHPTSGSECAPQALYPQSVEPPPSPAAPATKFGFSLEWAFPLSSRVEK
jgi:hypothetical protein